jgi:acyl transferase domain-containing protein
MSQQPIAIIGMACVYPGAPDLETYWRNIESGFDAISDMPPDRLDASFYDPSSNATDRIYTRRGGFIDRFADFDPIAFGVMPVTADTVDPDHMLALRVAEGALADAGYLDRTASRERTSVILGRGGYVGPGMMRWIAEVFTANQLVETLRDVVPGLTDDQLAQVKAEYQSRTGIKGADSAVGLIPNLVASRIANRFDFGGSAYTLDAACASSLVAVDRGCAELARGETDMVLAGGVHVSDVPTFWTGFSQLRALSRSQQIRPFDRRADGLLIGEGVGMVVLKRLEDAERDGDRIYAVVRGIGIASDGHATGLFNPRVEGQVLALQRAWQNAGEDPHTVGLIEAHGTAMVAGDAAEIETLRRVFGPAAEDEARAGLGSVKSMIGHTMPAAGAAGLIKASLALYYGVLPPSLHCEEANEALEQTRFRVIQKSEPWDATQRRAAVNAFGFGGINAHVVVDAHRSAPVRTGRRRSSHRQSNEMLILATPTQAALLDAVKQGAANGGSGPWRIAVSDPTPERLATAVKAVEAGRERFGRDGIYFSPTGVIAEGGKVAFLFPGVEAQFDPRVEDVAERFGQSAPDLSHTNNPHPR